MTSFIKFFWKKESHDLKLIFLLSLSIPLCWIFFLNWNLHFSISSNDATKILFPFYPDLVRNAGDWRSVLYRPELLGGFIIEGYFGSYPVTRALAWLGLGPLTCLNLTFLTIHTIYAFFSVRIALGLTELWRQGNPSPEGAADSPASSILNKLPGYFGFGLLNAFLPVLAWRMSYGHPNIVSGSFLFLGFFCIVLLRLLNKITLTCLLITAISWTHCFQYQSHQLALYSVIFGGPILFGLILSKNNSRIKDAFIPVILPCLLAVGAFAYSFDVFLPFFAHSVSSDTARSILGQNITYSYLTSTLWDWVTSLPWSAALVKLEQPNSFVHHEINYPIGPIVLLLFLVPWNKKSVQSWRPFGIGLFISIFLALIFSMKIEPFAELLSTVIPPLKFFRVPARAILPFAFLLPALASATLLARNQKSPFKIGSLIFVGISSIVLLFPSDTRELFLWGFAILAVLHFKDGTKESKYRIGAGAFLLVFGIASLLEFRERLLPFWSEETLETIPLSKNGEIYQEAPHLQSSLTRAMIDFEAEPYSLNRGYPLGISTLAGYFSPPARFIQLYSALNEMRMEIMTQVFDFNESMPGYFQLRELYNVAYKVQEINGRYRTTQIGDDTGEAWFSKKLSSFPEIYSLLTTLKREGSNLKYYLRDSAAYLSDDPIIKKSNLPSHVSPLCSQAKILQVAAPQHSQIVRLRVETPEDCPLSVSMNYVEVLEATGSSAEGKIESLKVFPVYGALTGVLVKKGVNTITIEAKSNTPFFVLVIKLLGSILILAILASSLERYSRSFRRISSPSHVGSRLTKLLLGE